MTAWHPDCTCYSSCECCCLCLGEDAEDGYVPPVAARYRETDRQGGNPYASLDTENGVGRLIIDVQLPPLDEDA